jgi:hypothetical protein
MGRQKMSHKIHIIDNFISPEDAETLIREQTRPSEQNPYPEYFAKRFGGTSFPYNKTVVDLQVKYGRMSNDIHKELNGFLNPIYVFKGFGSHWQAGDSGGLHLDAQDPEPWIEWSTIIYLSNENDYEGGSIYFPNQDFIYSPKQYSAVFFPSAGSENVHGITEVTSGHRYTSLYMHTSLPQHADPDYHTAEETSTWAAGNHSLARP